MPKQQRKVKENQDTPLGQIKESYYTAKEAYERLGLSRDSFNSMVRRDPDDFGRRVLWRGHGYYSKEKIDNKALEIQSLIIADVRTHLEFRVARLEDLEQEDHLAYLHFGSGSLSPERKRARREYLAANPYSTFHLYDGDQLVAFLNLIPMKHDAIVEFQKGVRGWTFPTDKIEQFKPGHRLECIIIDMATLVNAPLEKRNRFGGYLLHHVMLQLIEWGKQGVDIKSVDACGGTLDGRRVLKKAGFTFTGIFKAPAINTPEVMQDRAMYHLDIDTSDSPLLNRYKQAVQEYKGHR